MEELHQVQSVCYPCWYRGCAKSDKGYGTEGVVHQVKVMVNIYSKGYLGTVGDTIEIAVFMVVYQVQYSL